MKQLISLEGNIILGNNAVLSGKIESGRRLTLSGDMIVNGGKIYPVYTGEIEVTPSAYEQTLYTEDLVLMKNIKINPIPQNYGLITWNGSTLKVS